MPVLDLAVWGHAMRLTKKALEFQEQFRQELSCPGGHSSKRRRTRFVEAAPHDPLVSHTKPKGLLTEVPTDITELTPLTMSREPMGSEYESNQK